jgi:hypothetical protein
MEINKEILENNIEGFSLETPLREDAFKLDDELKIELISKHFKEIMQILQVLKLIMIDNENNLAMSLTIEILSVDGGRLLNKML